MLDCPLTCVTLISMEATTVAHRSYGTIRTPGRSSGSAYTWRRRKGPNGVGLLMLATLCLVAMLLGSSRPLALQTSSAMWAHTGNRSNIGLHIHTLSSNPDNLV